MLNWRYGSALVLTQTKFFIWWQIWRRLVWFVSLRCAQFKLSQFSVHANVNILRRDLIMMALEFCGTWRRANTCNNCGSCEGFLSQYICFPLWVSFHQFSILIFIYMLLLADRQMGEAWEPSEKQWSFGKRGAFTRRVLSFNFQTSAQTQPSKSYPNLVVMQPFTHKLRPAALLLSSAAHFSSNTMLSLHRHVSSSIPNVLKPLSEGRMVLPGNLRSRKSSLFFSSLSSDNYRAFRCTLPLLLLCCILAWSLTWQG